ncbi:hypothetical protein CBL_09058 [Carabus blaptoides fortunei]
MSEKNKIFSCVLCGTKLDTKEALQEHFRKHANKEIDAKGNEIKSVPVKSTTPMKKEAPLPKEETSKEKVICDVCQLEFATVTLAIQHKFKKHPESSTKHFCPYCGMQFPLKFTRDKHVETHKNSSTTGSFPCSECGVIFYNTQAQNYHFKSTHKRIMSIFKPIPTPPPSKKIKINNANEAQSVYYCYLCGMEYIIKFNLQKHLERAHSEQERNKVPDDLIKCTTCDALFYTKKGYDNHNIYHKPDDLYVTSEEQRLQTVTRVDQDFDIRRVQLAADKFIPVDKPKNRRSATINKAQISKQHGDFKTSDDELSPTSSVDSTDSETEATTTHAKNISKTEEDLAGHSKQINSTADDTKTQIVLKQKTKKGVKRSRNSSPKRVIRNGTTLVD